MKKELIQSLAATVEANAQQTDTGVEYWLARDLRYLLGYAKWDNFLNVVSKAKTACEVSGHDVRDHFADAGQMVVDRDAAAGGYTDTVAYLSLNRAVEPGPRIPYTSPDIRPMAVRPLDHPERWPTPWGFLFSEAGAAEGRLQ